MIRKNVAAKTITSEDRINRPAVSNWEVRSVTHTPSMTILDMGTTTLEFSPEDEVSVSVFTETVEDITRMVEREGDTLVSVEDIKAGRVAGRLYGYSAGAIVQIRQSNIDAHLASKHTVPVFWVSNTTIASMIRRA